MSAVINFRIDKKTKTEAQTIAKKMGLNLTNVLNVILLSFVRNKSLDIGQKSLSQNVKLVVHVPVSHADIVRKALGEAGAGRIGNYDVCSFSVRGIGRSHGNEKSNPYNAKAGDFEKVEEERIEVTVFREILKDVITKMKAVHPYEEVTFDIYSLEDFN